MMRSPALTGMPAAPITTQLISNVIVNPFGTIDPFGQAAPLMAFLTSSVLSAYMMVMMSVAGPEVPSGLVTVGPRPLPGSMAGRITLHPTFAALGPWKTRFNDAGGRLTLPPTLHPAALMVLGIEIPPVGIPVPVWIRS